MASLPVFPAAGFPSETAQRQPTSVQPGARPAGGAVILPFSTAKAQARYLRARYRRHKPRESWVRPMVMLGSAALLAIAMTQMGGLRRSEALLVSSLCGGAAIACGWHERQTHKTH